MMMVLAILTLLVTIGSFIARRQDDKKIDRLQKKLLAIENDVQLLKENAKKQFEDVQLSLATSPIILELYEEIERLKSRNYTKPKSSKRKKKK